MSTTLIVTEIQNGKIREASYELASFAHELGGSVKSLVMGQGVEALADEFSKKGAATSSWPITRPSPATTPRPRRSPSAARSRPAAPAWC